ncbi:MAG: DEAD/DEAH box helicase [Deltaproteobacteria bacterium]|nr:DEAD/DEAH box helicase [Deltaproteobacteria bacterium]
MKHFFLFLKTLFSKKQETKPAPPPPPSRPKSETPIKRRAKPKKKKWSVNNFKVEPKQGETRFHDFDLPLSVMHAISDLKFEFCTPVQAKLLPHTLEGKDATAKAQTGTGKSASFIITILTAFIKKSFKNKNGMPRALILAPTRELVYQIEKDFKALSRYANLRIISIFGGTGYNKQQTMLKEKAVDIIVATPGRLIDFMNKKLIDPSRVEIIVIDEADRMLDMGFIPDVRRIIFKTPHKSKRQTLFFSATLTADVLRLAESWTTPDAVQIEIDPEQAAADSIHQIIYISTETDKFKHVYNLINNEKLKRVILFVNRKDTARTLSEKFERHGLKCSVLSGDIPQDKRFKVLNNFRNGRINLLVATDVAARGLHVEDISHVINYDLPHEPEHYIHRIGRTGRAGAKGTSISFADEMSSFFIPKIEEVLGNKIKCEYPSEELEKPLPRPRKKYYSKKPGYQKRKPLKSTRRPSKYRQK